MRPASCTLHCTQRMSDEEIAARIATLDEEDEGDMPMPDELHEEYSDGEDLEEALSAPAPQERPVQTHFVDSEWLSVLRQVRIAESERERECVCVSVCVCVCAQRRAESIESVGWSMTMAREHYGRVSCSIEAPHSSCGHVSLVASCL